jgi:hypothetical protein
LESTLLPLVSLLLLLNNFDYILNQNDSILTTIQQQNKHNNNSKCYQSELESLNSDLAYAYKLPDFIVIGMFRVDILEVKKTISDMI